MAPSVVFPRCGDYRPAARPEIFGFTIHKSVVNILAIRHVKDARGESRPRLSSRPALLQRGSAFYMTERNMNSVSGPSLRSQVEKWLAPAPAISGHVTRFRRTRLGGRRCVYVETSSSRGVRALFFFRHDDGSWYVFPPAGNPPRGTADRIARKGSTPASPPV